MQESKVSPISNFQTKLFPSFSIAAATVVAVVVVVVANAAVAQNKKEKQGGLIYFIQTLKEKKFSITLFYNF